MRWSVYFATLTSPLVALNSVQGTADHPLSTELIVVMISASVIGSVLCGGTFRAGLNHRLGRRPAPVAWLVANGLLLATAVPALLLLAPVPAAGKLPVTTTEISYLTTFCCLSIITAMPLRAGILTCTAVLLLLVPAGMLAGTSLAVSIGLTVAITLWSAVLGAAWRSSVWIVSVVWELDAARETQAQLAVAEERLRFSRDLHDVMGRNLTTIALKSELAVQLARRGRPEAAEQMAEVQRIAQESQREVREVVRGYRAADLQAELTGARSVLRAAQVECTTELAEGTTAMPPAVQSVLGWVIREATTNVLRHSDARYCSIRLRLADGRAVLEIENDGVPTIPKPSTGSGTGLAGLRERLVVLGGELTCGRPGSGRHRLTAGLPLTAGSPDTALEASTP